MRAYLRTRHDQFPALFISKDDERLTYDGLRQILERKAKKAGLENKPTLNGFRRAFALNMLRSGVDIFALRKKRAKIDGADLTEIILIGWLFMIESSWND